MTRASNYIRPYEPSFKTIATAGVDTACGDRTAIYPIPPQDALTIERLFTHFVFTFDTSVSAGLRFIKDIGIIDAVTESQATYKKFKTLNLACDANRRVDITADLTNLLKSTNVLYSDDTSLTGFTFVMVRFDPSLSAQTLTGSIDLWKVDSLYTTDGIR